jgi:drug/metabolite transporter (DMT)-like permease
MALPQVQSDHSSVMKDRNRSVTVVLAFLAIYFIWGTTYLAVVFGLRGFPPFFLSAFRFGIAGVLLLGYSLAKGESLPFGRSLIRTFNSGVLMLVGGSGLVTWAEQYVPSGYAAVVVASEPFIFVLLDKKRWSFYFTKQIIVIGLIIGFVGVVTFILSAPATSAGNIPGTLMVWGYITLFMSSLLWVAGSLYSNNNPDKSTSTVMITSVQLLAASMVSVLLGFLTSEHSIFSIRDVDLEAWAGLAYLTFMGSIVAFFSYTWLLTVRPPAQVSTHTYVNPVVAVFVGWWIVNEPISTVQLIAIVIILIGVLLTTGVKSSASV